MQCNVFCPGPSLALASPAAAELTIAVNRAGVVPCDWWCFLDPEGALGVLPNRPRPLPRRFCTTLATHRRLCDEFAGDFVGCQFKAVEELGLDIRRDTNWHRHTMTVAMLLAESCGAKHLRIYGCDWQGSHYFDGTADPLPSQERFKSEMHAYGHVTAWLAKRGVAVERVLCC